MDDLDREIEEAARHARQMQWRGRLASVASVGTFFLVAVVGIIVVLALFPEPDTSAYDARRREQKALGADAKAEALAGDYSAYTLDRSRMRLKITPVFVLAFASAYLVSKRLNRKD
jgi:hypothetical protein